MTERVHVARGALLMDDIPIPFFVIFVYCKNAKSELLHLKSEILLRHAALAKIFLSTFTAAAASTTTIPFV